MSLVVEDGTGLSNAESYISVADATTYISLFYLSSDSLYTAWQTALASNGNAGTNCEIALRRSTRDLDAIWGPSYLSSPLTSTQALLFPRVAFYEYGRGGEAYQSPSGFYYYDDTTAIQVTGIPAGLARATVELALILLNGFDITGPLDRSYTTEREYQRVGGLINESQYFYPASQSALKSRKVSSLMAPYVNTDPFGANYPLIRG